MNFELVDWYIIGPAMVAGLLVLSTHVPLGQVVLKRGIIFIDLAVAQVAALGVIAAGAFGLEENIYAVQVSAISAAILAAAGLNWTEKHWPEIQEGFYLTFAFAITAAVQIVGVYLVFASLILPALATRRLEGYTRLWSGYLVGATAYFIGIVISALLDLPTGAVIVWTMAAVALIWGWTVNRRS
jgi:ABC-type Mn2+/Zn2+ transport system permease subunit